MPSERADAVVRSLRRLGSRATRDGMARYAIPSERAFGVPMARMQALARGIGRDHDLALALWETDWYEARTVAAYIDEPERVTAAQMDRWCRDFDNWAICDTVCFVLFDRSPHAFRKVGQWAKRKGEIQKRAAFVLLACLALHDKSAADAAFLAHLPALHDAASDGRNFVKKAVSWALRAIGRRNRALHRPAVELARRLAGSEDAAERWVGKDARRELENPKVIARIRR